MGASTSLFSCLTLATYSRSDEDDNHISIVALERSSIVDKQQAPLVKELLNPSHTESSDQCTVVNKIEGIILATANADIEDDDVILDCAAVVAMLQSLHFITDVNALLFNDGRDSLLHFSITTRNLYVVKTILALKVFDINCLNRDSLSCLHLAHEIGNEDIVEEIMRCKGALASGQKQACPQLVNSVSSIGTENFVTPSSRISCFSPLKQGGGVEEKINHGGGRGGGMYISLQDLASRGRSRASSSAPNPNDLTAPTTNSNDDFAADLDTVASRSDGSSNNTVADGKCVEAVIETVVV